jgi:hypothetical protein
MEIVSAIELFLQPPVGGELCTGLIADIVAIIGSIDG